MKNFLMRLLRLILGLFLYALGINFTLKANVGYAPWDVFHVGFSRIVGMSIGTTTIITGVVIVLITVILGEKVGLGTILNMLLIGAFLDILLVLQLIPTANNLLLGILMIIVGLFIVAFATYFYISTGFGAGPRDSLMVALTRKTKLPVGICRGTIEFLAVFIGWRLGGMVGIGTVLSALLIGFCVQITFKFLKFDTTKIKHETLAETFRISYKNKDELFLQEESPKNK